MTAAGAGFRRPGGVAACALGVLLLFAQAGPAAAQTPITAIGLGYPTPPVDARAAGLGGAGLALPGGTFSLRNPADLTLLSTSGLSVSAAPEGVDLRGPGGFSSETGRGRFSVLRTVISSGEWRFSLGFGSELDQGFRLSLEDTLDTSLGRFPFEEIRENSGGISVIDLSLARRVGPLSLGVTYQRLVGSLRQTLVRRFGLPGDTTEVLEPPEGVVETSTVDYGGGRVKAGIGLRPLPRVRLSASYSRTGDLSADRAGSGPEEPRTTGSVPMPEEVAAGASIELSDRWLLTGGGGWSGWSAASGALESSDARDVRWGSGGIEVRGIRVGAFPVSLRAGARAREMPFSLPDREAPGEAAFTFGLGSEIPDGAASLDLAFEAGSRGDGASGAEEGFLRFTATAALRR